MWQRCRKYKIIFSVLVLVSLLTVAVSGTLTHDVNALGANFNAANFRNFRSQLLSPDLLNKELTLNSSSSEVNADGLNPVRYTLSDSDINLLADTATTYADNNLSLEIGGQGFNDVVKTLPGQVAYRAHTVKVTSSNIKSYTLTINGPVGLKNANAASTTSANTISGAGGKTPANMANNSWGYAYNQSGNNSAMTYISFTGSNQQLEKASTSPNFTKNLVFAAKFADNAEAGHYQATVKLSLTATPKVITTYTLSYNANSGSNAPTTQAYTDDTEAGSHTFTISSSKPTRSGYEFSSWNTNSSGTGTNYNPSGTITISASSPTQTLYAKWAQIYTRTLSYNMNGGSGGPSNQSCSSTSTSCSITISSTKPTKTNYTFLGWSTSSTATSASYQPGSSITLSSDTTLYALWKDTRTLSNISNMQDMNKDICANTSVGSSKSLKDTRDNNYYTVRKFADNNCWMTSNLLLKGNRTLTPDDSNVISNYTLPATLTSLSSADFSESDKHVAKSYNTSGASSGNTMYYTWGAAVAGNGDAYYGSSQSVCPKGWILPSEGTTSDGFKNFMSAESIADSSAGSTKIQGSPYNFKYTGYINNGVLKEPTTEGGWWTSDAGGTSAKMHSYAIQVRANGTSSANTYRQRGYAVRCIATRK